MPELDGVRLLALVGLFGVVLIVGSLVREWLNQKVVTYRTYSGPQA